MPGVIVFKNKNSYMYHILLTHLFTLYITYTPLKCDSLFKLYQYSTTINTDKHSHKVQHLVGSEKFYIYSTAQMGKVFFPIDIALFGFTLSSYDGN